MQSLQMQPGNYTTYADHCSELASQLRGLKPTHLMYMFLNVLTADCKQHVFLHVECNLIRGSAENLSPLGYGGQDFAAYPPVSVGVRPT